MAPHESDNRSDPPSQWYYASGGTRFGPVLEGQIRAMAASGELGLDDLVWHVGMSEWLPARNVPGLLTPPPLPSEPTPARETIPEPVQTETNDGHLDVQSTPLGFEELDPDPLGSFIALVECRECGGQVDNEAPSCPHCGVPNPAPESNDTRLEPEMLEYAHEHLSRGRPAAKVVADLLQRGLNDSQAYEIVNEAVRQVGSDYGTTVTPLSADASETANSDRDTPLFLYITPVRLILMSITSWGLYEAYWIYKNWRYIKERDGLSISPLWRGWFGIFFCHSLLRRIHEDKEAGAIQKPAFSAGGLATGWVIFLIFAAAINRQPDIEASIVAVFIPSFLFLVPVQNYVNAVTEKRNPAQEFYGWSSGHVVCLVLGVIVWVLTLSALGA